MASVTGNVYEYLLSAISTFYYVFVFLNNLASCCFDATYNIFLKYIS